MTRLPRWNIGCGLAPTDLTTMLNADGSITPNWNAPHDNTVAGYQVLRRRGRSTAVGPEPLAQTA
ncbi:hypothetical protein [Candidatus Poriferisodalis sp.]|uniref:hypothetical protein n=1 Tax=Candidatus Poriferisodalis sp. TaxID=3101277 RepID=UPI003B58E032